MVNNEYYLTLARSYAELSEMKKGKSMGYSAIVVNNKKIISIGVNNYGLSPFCSKYSTHAEIDAINKCKNKKKLKGAKIYVAKLNGKAEVCKECLAKLEKIQKKFGLKKIIT